METRIYYFSAEWCGPCKQFKPLMESLEIKGYPIYFQDVDTAPILAESYQIKSVPSIKIVQDNNVVDSMVGVQDPVSLVQKFEMYAPLQTDEDES